VVTSDRRKRIFLRIKVEQNTDKILTDKKIKFQNRTNYIVLFCIFFVRKIFIVKIWHNFCFFTLGLIFSDISTINESNFIKKVTKIVKNKIWSDRDLNSRRQNHILKKKYIRKVFTTYATNTPIHTNILLWKIKNYLV
jgi:hypothetical protein